MEVERLEIKTRFRTTGPPRQYTADQVLFTLAIRPTPQAVPGSLQLDVKAPKRCPKRRVQKVPQA